MEIGSLYGIPYLLHSFHIALNHTPAMESSQTATEGASPIVREIGVVVGDEERQLSLKIQVIREVYCIWHFS